MFMKRVPICFVFILCSLSAFCQNYQTHSLFIYSFTRFVQWPDEDKAGDFEILVLGETPMLADLKTMAERKKVGDRTIKITKINGVTEIRKCHMLVLPTDKSALFNEVLAKTDGMSTLVITEVPGLGAKGSCINFIVKENKLAFELNQAAITKHKLKASAELARLAIII